MPEKDQIYIYNSTELSLIKNTFADNDILLYAIRKVFLQFPLTDVEKGLIKMSVTQPVFDVLKKRILPDISNEFPLGQLPSILTTLTNDLRVKDADEMAPQFSAKMTEIAYLQQQFDELAVIAGLAEPKKFLQRINLSELGEMTLDSEQTFSSMTAYLFLLGYIDPMLIMIKTIAGGKDESPKEQNNRMKRDSTK